jgi:alpha-aminoadipate carrier protein LysW
MSALCVECDAELNIGGRARIGQRIVCPSCGAQLEVISARPLEVDIAYDDGEEWDDLDGYSLDDDDDLDDVGRLNGAKALDDWDDDLDDLDDELDDDLEADLDDDLEDDLAADLADDLDAGREDKKPRGQ